MKLNMTYYGNTRNTNDFDKIMDYLYIGNIDSLKFESTFSLIVNCTREIECVRIKDCIQLPLRDDPGESDKMLHYINEKGVLEKIYETINRKENVLVHCYAGMQRSCAVVACYLVKYYNISPTTAIEFIKKNRPVAFFYNVNFMKTIQDVYNMKKIA